MKSKNVFKRNVPDAGTFSASYPESLVLFFFLHTGIPGSPNSPEVANGLFQYDERHLVLRRCRVIGIVDYKAACSAPE